MDDSELLNDAQLDNFAWCSAVETLPVCSVLNKKHHIRPNYTWPDLQLLDKALV